MGSGTYKLGAVEFDDTWTEEDANDWLAARSLRLYDIAKERDRKIPEVDILVEMGEKVCCVCVNNTEREIPLGEAIKIDRKIVAENLALFGTKDEPDPVSADDLACIYQTVGGEYVFGTVCGDTSEEKYKSIEEAKAARIDHCDECENHVVDYQGEGCYGI